MLCITLDSDALNSLAPVFKLNRPQFYDVSFSSSATRNMPDLSEVCNTKAYVKTAASNISTIASVGGTQFTVFSKTAEWVCAVSCVHLWLLSRPCVRT
jgi:hypothetical protein